MTVDLPVGWANPLLSEIAQINPPLDRCIIDDDLPVSFVPMRAVETDGKGLLRPEARSYSEVKRGYTPFLSGDVIMAKITPCMENGKTTVVPKLEGDVCFGSTEFHVLRPEKGISAHWIANLLICHDIRRAAQRQMSGGVGQMRVPSAFLETTRIPLPPASELQRIIDALDELFSDLDAAVEGLERTKKKLDLYRASILKAAVEGALTAEWRAQHPNMESASELLKRILAERHRSWEEEQVRKFKDKGKEPPTNWRARYKEPYAPITIFPGPIPHTWASATADQVTSVITDGEHITPQRSESGVLLLSARNVLNGRLSLDQVDYVSEGVFAALNKRLKIEEGDVLLSCSGTVGRSCLVPADLRFSLVRSVAVLKPVLKMGAYISLCIRSIALQSQIAEKKTQTAQSNIFQEKIKKLILPIAPFAEQEAIVEMVEDQLSVVEQLERDIVEKLKVAQSLRQSILRYAFEGKLVPQDPNDEPASELLTRIAAAREEPARDGAAAKQSNKKTKSSRRRDERG